MEHHELEAIVCAILTSGAISGQEPLANVSRPDRAFATYQQILKVMREHGGPLQKS